MAFKNGDGEDGAEDPPPPQKNSPLLISLKYQELFLQFSPTDWSRIKQTFINNLEQENESKDEINVTDNVLLDDNITERPSKIAPNPRDLFPTRADEKSKEATEIWENGDGEDASEDFPEISGNCKD